MQVHPGFAGFNAGSIRLRYRKLEQADQGSGPSTNAPLLKISARGGQGAGAAWGTSGVIDVTGPDLRRLIGSPARGNLNGERLRTVFFANP